MSQNLLLLASAVAFVFVTGANDGSSLLALGMRHPNVPVRRIFLLLGAALLLGPSVFGLSVAEAFTGRLVDLDRPSGKAVFLSGLIVSLVVVLGLTSRGVPTSLTLAIVGGIAGAGLGAGLPVAWRSIAVILAVAAAAPVAGGLIGYAVGMLARRAPLSDAMPSVLRNAHVLAFSGQCLAYAANDGQKMFAVVSVAAQVGSSDGGTVGSVIVPWPLMMLTAAVFFLGAMTTVRAVTHRVSRDLLLLRPVHAVGAELASSAAVFGSVGFGVPVSMTQSITAGVVGVGASQGWRRVRWPMVMRVGMAWVLTLPTAVLAGAVVGLGLRIGS